MASTPSPAFAPRRCWAPGAWLGLLAITLALAAPSPAGEESGPRHLDLSLIVASGYPCNWPTWPRFLMTPDERIGPLGAYATYAPEVRGWLAEYQKEFGPRGTSLVTADEVPIAQTCGPARIIDVAGLAGTTDRASWPASPEITEALIRMEEDTHGAIRPGDVVIFRSGWSDRFYRPAPEGKACLDDPLNGKGEGWPAPGPGAIRYLARRGVRCVATDAPSLGGVDPKRALMTYWALGGAGMAGVEYLTDLAKVPGGAYFLFASVKIRGCHGGPGRAIALW